MKFATKYMVVPFNQNGGFQSFENPEETQINNLDASMTTILSKKINLDEKLKLYSQALAKFATVYHPNTFSLPNVLAELADKTNQVEKTILEKIDLLAAKKQKIKKERLDVKNESDDLDEYSDAREDPFVLKKTKKNSSKRLVKKPKKLDVSLSNVLVTKRKKKQTVLFQSDNSTQNKNQDTDNQTELVDAEPVDTEIKKARGFFNALSSSTFFTNSK